MINVIFADFNSVGVVVSGGIWRLFKVDTVFVTIVLDDVLSSLLASL